MAKHIAVVTPIYPHPADTGTKLRILKLMQVLHEAGFALSLIVYDPTFDGVEVAPALKEICHRSFVIPPMLAAMKGGLVRRLWEQAFGRPIPTRPALRRLLHEKLVEWAPDFVQAEKTFSAAHLHMKHLRATGVRVVLEEGGVHHLAYEREAARAHGAIPRLLARRRARRLRHYEARLLGDVDGVTAVSSKEAALLRELLPTAPVFLVPNGVDEQLLAAGTVPLAEREWSLFFCGNLSYVPNADAVRYFLDEILPELAAAGVDAKLVVAGGGAPKDIAAVAESSPSLELLGYVDDISACFARYSIMINPMRLGGGTRLKLLEAMAHGMACISTSVGAEGLNIKDGREVLLADTATDFALAVKRAVGHKNFAAEIGQSARALVRRQYLWSQCAKELIDFYRS